MSNPLFNELKNQQNDDALFLMQQFKEFKRNFKENPYYVLTSLLSNGQITQSDINEAQILINQIKCL